MVADFTVVCLMTVPVVLLGLVLGITYETGVVGAALFVLLGGLWGLAFTGFPYAIALKTGNPTAVNNAFLLFFPFAFLTTAYVPKEALTGWLSSIATYNPTTYLLDALRSLISGGWDGAVLAKGFGAVAFIGAISFSLAFAALRGRVSRS